MEKLLTVSIAAYNVEALVGHALDSLAACRQLDALDIIVVDDGSKDGTAQAVAPYVRRYPQSVRLVQKENGGYGSTINTSFALAQGRYFRLLDGDDTVDSAEMDKLLTALTHCEADLAVAEGYTLVYPTREQKVTLALDGMQRGAVYAVSQLENAAHIPMHALAVRTEALRMQPVAITEHCFYTDEEFVFWALAASRTVCVHAVCYYRYAQGVEGQSVSLEGSQKHYRDGVRCYEKLTALYLEHESSLLLLRYLADYLQAVYCRFLLIQPTRAHRKELMALHRFVLAHTPEAYARDSALKIRLLRGSGFLLYGPLCRIYQRKLTRGA